MYTYIYIYMNIHTYIYIFIHMILTAYYVSMLKDYDKPLLTWTNPNKPNWGWQRRQMQQRLLGAAVSLQIRILNDPAQTLLPICLQYSITQTHIFTYLHIYIHMYIFVQVYIHNHKIHMYICIYIYKHLYRSMHIYVYMHIRITMYMFVYVCINMHIHISYFVLVPLTSTNPPLLIKEIPRFVRPPAGRRPPKGRWHPLPRHLWSSGNGNLYGLSSHFIGIS